MNKHLKTLLPLVLLSLSLTSCGPRQTDDLSKAQPWIEQMYFDYTKAFVDDGFMISHLWSNSSKPTDPFGSTWNNSEVSGNNQDGLVLSVSKTDDMTLIRDNHGNQRNDFEPYLSSEIRTTTGFKYGYYGITMKASSISGIVSTFFLYTGPTENNPHDEIDFEFVGKNTRKVQLNYYAGNDIPHEYWLDLPFDASEDFHQYGVYWGKDELCWYIDNEPVYRLANTKTPSHECKVFTSCWKVTQKNQYYIDWGGELDESGLPSFAIYKNMTICDLDGNPMSNLPEGRPYNS